MEATSTRPLSQVEEGQTVSVICIDGGRGLRSRLTAMGLLPNIVVRMVRNGRGGPVVISIKNSRVALGRGVADKIRVVHID
jgi:Fe2+ transport system protein FeoA